MITWSRVIDFFGLEARAELFDVKKKLHAKTREVQTLEQKLASRIYVLAALQERYNARTLMIMKLESELQAEKDKNANVEIGERRAVIDRRDQWERGPDDQSRLARRGFDKGSEE